MTYGVTTLEPGKHRDALGKIWGENMVDDRVAPRVAARFAWMYEAMPHGKAHTWLGTHVETGDFVGCGSLVPRTMRVDGASYPAGILCDFAVVKNHRVAGAAIAIQRAISNGSPGAGMRFIFGFPNAASVAVCKRVGYAPIASSRAFVKPLFSAYKLKDRISSKLLLAPVAAAVDVGLLGRDLVTFAAGSLKHPPRLCRFELTDRLDERIDDLFARTPSPYVVGEKSAQYLNWRYADFTTQKHTFFVLWEPDRRRAIGFVAYHVENTKVFVDDLFCDFERDLDLLLFSFSQRMRAARHDSICVTYAGTPDLATALVRHHFIERPLDDRPLVVYTPKDADPSLRASLLQGDRWLMLDGELDL